MPHISDTISAVADRISQCREQRIGESNTKTNLIEPIVSALGWNILNIEEVRREYRGHGKNNPVDYALMILRKPSLVIEAKGLGEDIDDRRWLNQVVSYAAVLGVSWAVVTDGDAWKILNAMATVDVPDKLFKTIRVSEGPTAEVVNTLNLLSRENMQGNDIDALWQVYFTDRIVRDSLAMLLCEGDKRLSRIVKNVANNNLSIRDIQESLRRMEIKSVPNINNITVSSKSSGSINTAQNTSSRRPTFDFQKMGIAVGAEIRYRGGNQVAVVVGPNRVTYDGKEYSLTGLTKMLRGTTHALQPSGYWLYGDITLKEIYDKTYPTGEK